MRSTPAVACVSILDDSNNSNFAGLAFLVDSHRDTRTGKPKMIHSDPMHGIQ